jgi:alkylation response protein AidB-like acyl-CoA dehydrogenase
MDFSLSEEHIAVQLAARDFAKSQLLPGVMDRDELQQFPKEQVMQLFDLGFMGMMTQAKYGGAEMDTLSYVLAIEEISKVDASTAVCMSVNNSLVCWGLEKYGNEYQKEKYLTRCHLSTHHCH